MTRTVLPSSSPASFAGRRSRRYAPCAGRLCGLDGPIVRSVGSTARLARGHASLAALLGIARTARFAALKRGFATTFIYPGEQVARVTRLARALVPLTGAVLLGSVPVMRRRDLNRSVRAHYGLVTFAEVLFLGWLRKWNLLGSPSGSAPATAKPGPIRAAGGAPSR